MNSKEILGVVSGMHMSFRCEGGWVFKDSFS